jgi:hypothetical protein
MTYDDMHIMYDVNSKKRRETPPRGYFSFGDTGK